ncbi:MAG TPA: tetratricopeptide repeat protein [Planctomycetota bacterium]|nr:tetratricopeptide repeat protein [Planctomycetota bacterium]
MLDYAHRRKPAERAFAEAFRLQAEGRFAEAERGYRRSIALHASAEAHTFLGWTLSFLGRLSEAIAECRRAIEIDPDFGNPYNDIGAYLIQQGKVEDAIPWLERAKVAKRYECAHYPHYNLGRVYELLGRFPEALREYREALDRAREREVEYPHAAVAIQRVEAVLRRRSSSTAEQD